MKESGGTMENYPIKSVTFGGFDKQDVIRYIEQAANEAAAAQNALQTENDQLRQQTATQLEELSDLREQTENLTAQLEAMQAQCEQLKAELADAAALQKELEALKPLEEEVARLRPDAEAYAQFRDRLGTIECDGRKRADDLENATAAQLQKTVDLFRSQYQSLMATFESAASHVTSELRKVEVNLTQLPRVMDQSGAELEALSSQLDHIQEKQ
jgi:DNA repair exonuclease SbcCD ATPase subunit